MAWQHVVLACLLLALQAAAGQAKLTMIAYMLADNDLQCDMYNNLAQMVDAFKGMQLGAHNMPEVYIEFDNGMSRCKSSLPGVSSSDWMTMKALTLEPAPEGTGVRFKVLRDLGEVNSATDSQFDRFFDHTFALFPPKPDRQYFLLMADHGGGFQGLGMDHACNVKHRFNEDHACGPMMTVANISNVIQSALKRHKVPKLQLAAFDACLMGNWETLVALQPAVRYVLASEELEPGHGMDWSAYATLAKQPEVTAPQLADAIIIHFMDFCAANSDMADAQTQPCTMALYDLSKLHGLSRALAQVAQLLHDSMQALEPEEAAALAVELGLAGKATVLPGDENMADVMQLLEAVERVAGGNEHRLVNESALGLLRDGVAAARQGLQALQVQYQLLAPQGVSFSGLSIYLPTTVSHAGSTHASGIRGSRRSEPITMEAYGMLALSRAALQPLQDLYHSLHSAMSGNAPGSSGSGSARSAASGGSGAQLEVEQAEARLVQSRDRAPWVDYTVKPKASKVPNVEALQMVGFANPFNASTVLVTQAKQREANQAGAFFSNFPLHFLALQQALPSSSNDSSSAADDVRTVLAYAVGSDGFAQFDVLYGTSCHEPLSWLQPAQLTVQYHTKPDSDFQVTSISLYATDSGADSGKDGGKAEVEPGNAGVIIPLLAELDPSNASQLFMNWDMARCLKWRYADKISLRRVYPTELSVAANNVDVPADASVIAGTIVAATQVYGHSTASVSLVGLSPADGPGDAAADTEDSAASSQEAVTTARGCRCASFWAQPGAGQTYKGTCAARAEEGGPWEASSSAGFCLVQPDSCEVADDTAGGSVWDTCTAAAAGAEQGSSDGCQEPVKKEEARCVPLLLGACEDAGIKLDSATGALSLTTTASSCSLQCLQAVCELQASHWAGRCSDHARAQQVVGAVLRHLDSSCLAAGSPYLVPAKFKCTELLSQAEEVSERHHSAQQLSAPQGTLSLPGPYGPYTARSWEVHNRARPYISLDLLSFSTEEDYDVVYVSDAFGLRYILSGNEPLNQTFSTDSGYMLVQFFSDASISGAGFTMAYTASDRPQLPQACPAGTRAVTFFVDTRDADVYDIAWMVLEKSHEGAVASDAEHGAATTGGSSKARSSGKSHSSSTTSSSSSSSSSSRKGAGSSKSSHGSTTTMRSTVVASGGYVPSVAAIREQHKAYQFTGIHSLDTLSQLVEKAAGLAEGSMQYRPWSVATEVRCLKPGADYQLVPLAGNMSNWGHAGVTVAVPSPGSETGSATETLLVFLGGPDGAYGDGVFLVPEAESVQQASEVAARVRPGRAGFQASLAVAGDLHAEDVRGMVRGMVRMGLARTVNGTTNDVIIVGVHSGNSSSGEASAEEDTAAEEGDYVEVSRGRRLLRQGRKRLAASGSFGRVGGSRGAVGVRGPQARQMKPAHAVAEGVRRAEVHRQLARRRLAGRPAGHSVRQGQASRLQLAMPATASAAAVPSGVGMQRRALLDMHGGHGDDHSGVVITFKVIGYASEADAKAAMERLAADASDGSLLRHLLAEGLVGLSGVQVQQVQVMAEADASLQAAHDGRMQMHLRSGEQAG